MKFGFDWPRGFRGEDLGNCGRTTDDDGRTPEHGHQETYKNTSQESVQHVITGKNMIPQKNISHICLFPFHGDYCK